MHGISSLTKMLSVEKSQPLENQRSSECVIHSSDYVNAVHSDFCLEAE